MRHIAVALLIALVATTAAGQTITGFSGTADHGSTITIGGSSFGTKATAAPLLWDNMESGTIAAGYSFYDGTDNVASSTPAYQRHGNSSYVMYQNSYRGGSSNFKDTSIPAADKWYAQYWFCFYGDFDICELSSGLACDTNADTINDSSQNFGNVKFIRVHNPGSQVENFFILGSRLYAAGNFSYKAEYVSTEDTKYFSSARGGSQWDGDQLMDGGWHLLQFEYVNNTPGQANGEARLWIDGMLYLNDSAMTFQEDDITTKIIRLGFENSGPCPVPGDTDGFDHTLMDDFYADSSWARVEIGNASTYESCTHREIQIPTSWGASSISVTVNTGSFVTDDAAYLFVTTDAGDVSAGYPITIGASGGGIPDPGPLTAPTGLQVGGGN